MADLVPASAAVAVEHDLAAHMSKALGSGLSTDATDAGEEVEELTSDELLEQYIPSISPLLSGPPRASERRGFPCILTRLLTVARGKDPGGSLPVATKMTRLAYLALS